ncbi:ABC transporter substrate-binding protein [Cohnella sp. GbtcB17]|uniref:ABC transporter substrate-binding protein n=1 Tax=Cohnella sp. GbtcB17 TaxID=2824762 RepID=UPI001C2FB193|nr:ABC transporter substrate-binding protein [Cohnella sp. GbtcB17]
MKKLKQGLALWMVVGLTIIALGACSNGNRTESGAESTAAVNSPSASVSQTTTAPAMKPYKDKFGEKNIPVNPGRIVSISSTTDLLALGMQPIGAMKYEVEPDYYLNSYKNPIPKISDWPINYEAVAAAEPDLILAFDMPLLTQEIYDQLSKIAPTVVPADVGLYDHLLEVADLFDKRDAAESWLAHHREKAAAAKAEIAGLVGADETVAAIRIDKATFSVYANRAIGHVLYDLLGLKPYPLVQQAIDNRSGKLVYADGTMVYAADQLNLEVLPQYDADRLVVMLGNDPAAEDNFKQLQKSALWQNLKAVKENHVYLVPYDKWWSYTLFSADALLTDAVALFKP